ncbi:hypothetical protein SUGI_0844970, partial [Cryptomeria japonica]
TSTLNQYHSAHMNSLFLTEKMRLSWKMKGFLLIWEAALHSEYMGRLKNSSSTFVVS